VLVAEHKVNVGNPEKRWAHHHENKNKDDAMASSEQQQS
jgi:hypothetical protein